MSKWSLIIGGPAYNMELDARNAGSIVNLALAAALDRRTASMMFHWEHGNPVDRARDSVMEKAIASDATHFISADYDVSWPDQGASQSILEATHQLERLALPFCGFPVPQRNGDTAIIFDSDYSKRLKGVIEASEELKPCWATGMGLAVFYLPWYRRHWPDPPWFRTDFEMNHVAGKPLYVSEDVWHTSQLNHRGDKPGPRYMAAFPIFHQRGTQDVLRDVRHTPPAAPPEATP